MRSATRVKEHPTARASYSTVGSLNTRTRCPASTSRRASTELWRHVAAALPGGQQEAGHPLLTISRRRDVRPTAGRSRARLALTEEHDERFHLTSHRCVVAQASHRRRR